MIPLSPVYAKQADGNCTITTEVSAMNFALEFGVIRSGLEMQLSFDI